MPPKSIEAKTSMPFSIPESFLPANNSAPVPSFLLKEPLDEDPTAKYVSVALKILNLIYMPDDAILYALG